jgi:hypothetical protein
MTDAAIDTEHDDHDPELGQTPEQLADMNTSDEGAAPEASSAPRKRLPPPDVFTWAPSESAARDMVDAEFGSQILKRNWKKLFIRAQISCAMLQLVVPESGTLEQARGIEKLIETKFSELEKKLEDELARLHTAAANEGIVIPDMSFTDPVKVTVPIYTPAARRYFSLLCKVDRLYWVIDYLWIHGLLGPDHKWNLVNLYRKQLWTLTKETTDYWRRAKEAFRKEQAAKAKRFADKAAAKASQEAAEDSDAEGTATAAAA